MLERFGAHDIGFARPRDRRHAHAPAIAGRGGSANACARQSRGLDRVVGVICGAVGLKRHFRGRCQELLAVQCRKQRHAHQRGRGEPGQKGAAQPTQRHFALVRRPPSALGNCGLIADDIRCGSGRWAHKHREEAKTVAVQMPWDGKCVNAMAVVTLERLARQKSVANGHEAKSEGSPKRTLACCSQGFGGQPDRLAKAVKKM